MEGGRKRENICGKERVKLGPENWQQSHSHSYLAY